MEKIVIDGIEFVSFQNAIMYVEHKYGFSDGSWDMVLANKSFHDLFEYLYDEDIESEIIYE